MWAKGDLKWGLEAESGSSQVCVFEHLHILYM